MLPILSIAIHKATNDAVILFGTDKTMMNTALLVDKPKALAMIESFKKEGILFRQAFHLHTIQYYPLP
jgi:hypothetical protein